MHCLAVASVFPSPLPTPCSRPMRYSPFSTAHLSLTSRALPHCSHSLECTYAHRSSARPGCSLSFKVTLGAFSRTGRHCGVVCASLIMLAAVYSSPPPTQPGTRDLLGKSNDQRTGLLAHSSVGRRALGRQCILAQVTMEVQVGC